MGIGRKKLYETGKIFHNKDIHNLHFSPNLIRFIKSRMIRLAGSVSGTVRREMRKRFSGKPVRNEVTW